MISSAYWDLVIRAGIEPTTYGLKVIERQKQEIATKIKIKNKFK
jgi:hypothetical protein